MAIIGYVLQGPPDDVGVYTIARSITGESTVQLRKRAADGKPLVNWDTDDFAIASERASHHDSIRHWLAKLTSCDCEYELHYRPSSDDESERIGIDQLHNLLDSEIQYEQQEHD